MIFKKIDRYISWAFLSRFLGGAGLLGVLYVTFDLLKQLEDLQGTNLASTLPKMASYYTYVIALFLSDITPALILMAAGMALVSMVRRRELLVLKATGTSIYRVVAPIFFWTLLINLAVFGFRETMGPQVTKKREILNRVLEKDVETRLLLRDDRFDRRIFVRKYNFSTGKMQDVSLLEFYRGERPKKLRRIVQADTARYEPDEGVISMETVEVRQFDRSGAVVGKKVFRPTERIQTALTPFDFLRAAQGEGESFSLAQSLPELYRLIRQQPEIPHFRVLFHLRLASFFSPFILLLIGIPCLVGFERSIRSRSLSIIITIVVAAGFYALSFVFASMGDTQSLPPALAGWFPSIAGGAAGLWLFESMLT